MQPPQKQAFDQAEFRKSSYSQSEAACVEVADLDLGVAIRDTQNRGLGMLAFDADEWQAFLDTAKGA
ncbi:DUF397 domain-containing protein [Nocardiopsis sp. CC223A]|uniref:DUF397 domain-containing protein n=1 Tax=Nocardiopsis sp. CC223A TaxID=3044051 RepID=UPI00278C879C|nr:DUF397 domain-containing protein [Nocardiopsis sp. CC223A]